MAGLPRMRREARSDLRRLQERFSGAIPLRSNAQVAQAGGGGTHAAPASDTLTRRIVRRSSPQLLPIARPAVTERVRLCPVLFGRARSRSATGSNRLAMTGQEKANR